MAKATKTKSGDVHMRVKPAKLARWEKAVARANMQTLTAWLTKLAEDEADRLGVPRSD